MGLLDRFRRHGDEPAASAGAEQSPTVQQPAAPVDPAAGIAGLRFPLARGKGYRRDEVDLFLVRASGRTADEIRDTHFRTEWRGYVMDDVDSLLGELEKAARERADGGTTA